jgi:superfamily II DNA/RNA helicase
MILKGKDVVIGAETGGGKTLTYLLPFLQKVATYPIPMEEIHRPVGIVLTSSQELVAQVHRMLHMLNEDMAKATVCLSSSNQILARRNCPLLIATPKAVLRVSFIHHGMKLLLISDLPTLCRHVNQ